MAAAAAELRVALLASIQAGTASIERRLIERKGAFMSDHHTYKKIEIVGSSRNSVDEALRNAVAEAGKTLQNLEWFEVGEIRGHIRDGQVAHYQVTVKIGFRLNDS